MIRKVKDKTNRHGHFQHLRVFVINYMTRKQFGKLLA